MADVFRRGTKSVHIGTRRSPELEPEQQIGCNLDPGFDWTSALPAGPICTACFGMAAARRADHRRRYARGATRAAVAGTTAVVLGAAVVFASSLDTPVNYFPTPVPAESPVLVTPGPSTSPSEAPVFTSLPTNSPVPRASDSALPTLPPFPTYPPVPTWPPLPTYPPLPTLPPLPTFGPLPTLPVIDPPDPTVPPIICVHPGQHQGVKDICQWPGNR